MTTNTLQRLWNRDAKIALSGSDVIKNASGTHILNDSGCIATGTTAKVCSFLKISATQDRPFTSYEPATSTTPREDLFYGYSMSNLTNEVSNFIMSPDFSSLNVSAVKSLMTNTVFSCVLSTTNIADIDIGDYIKVSATGLAVKSTDAVNDIRIGQVIMKELQTFVQSDGTVFTAVVIRVIINQ